MFYILNHDSQICLKTTYDPSTSVKWGQQCGPGCADKGNTEPLTFTAQQAPILYRNDLDFLNNPPLRDRSLALNALYKHHHVMNTRLVHGSVRISHIFV